MSQTRLAFALLGGFLVVGCGSTPTDQVISECIAGPRPPSLRILQAAEQLNLGSHHYYAHFRISKRDLDAILAAEPYKPSPLRVTMPDYSSLNLAAWWTPQALGKDLKAYQYEVADPRDKDESTMGKTLYHNATGDEVYLIKGLN